MNLDEDSPEPEYSRVHTSLLKAYITHFVPKPYFQDKFIREEQKKEGLELKLAALESKLKRSSNKKGILASLNKTLLTHRIKACNYNIQIANENARMYWELA